MPTPVALALKGEGVEKVKDALKGLKQSYVQMERESVAATREATRERLNLLKQESSAKVALLKQESRARREIMQAERSFKRTINQKETAYGLGAAGNALVKGESFEGVLKAAGVAGLAVAGFAAAIHLASASLKQFASWVVNDVVKPGWALETRSQQVANNSGGALNARGVESRAKALALKNGLDPMSLIDATGRFQDLTGEPGMGWDIMGTVAAISKGRGYDAKGMSELGAAMYRPGMKSGDLNQLLLTLTGQGEKGSIPIGELARLGGRLTAPAEHFGGDWFTKVTTANALLQTAKRTGFGTVEDAATGFQQFVQEGQLKGKSVSPKSFATINGTDVITDPVKYLGDLFRKTRGSALALHGMGFSEPAQKFIGAYQGTFSDAYASAKAGGKTEAQAREAGAAAVEEFVNSMKRATSSLAAEEARRDAVMNTAGERFAGGLERLKNRVWENVSPSMDKLASAFAEHADELAGAITPVIEVLGYLAQSGINLVEFWDNILNKKGEGDVVKRIVDKGASTVLPNMGDELGYWLHDKGMYSFIKGAQNNQIDGLGLKPMKGGLPDERHSMWGVYEHDTNPRVDAGRIASYFSPPANQSLEPNMSSSPDAGPTALSAEERESAKVAAEAHQKLADQTSGASDALCRLTTCVEDLASSLGQLDRSQPFTSH